MTYNQCAFHHSIRAVCRVVVDGLSCGLFGRLDGRTDFEVTGRRWSEAGGQEGRRTRWGKVKYDVYQSFLVIVSIPRAENGVYRSAPQNATTTTPWFGEAVLTFAVVEN